MAIDKTTFDDRSPALKAYDAIRFLAHKADRAKDRRVLNALRVISSNPSDVETVREVFRTTSEWLKRQPVLLARQQDMNPFQPYPGNIVSGPLLLGRVYNPYALHPIPFGLHFREILQHFLVFGRSGAGKTVILFLVLANLLRAHIPFLVADFKRDYRHLIRRSCKNLLIFSWKNFKFNPLAPPPGVDFLHWIQILADVFFESLFAEVPSASKSAFLETLTELFERFEKQYGPGVYPSPLDLVDEIERVLSSKGADGKQKERLRTILSRLRPLCRILRDMFDCQEGFPIETLLHCPVVLELDGLTMEIQSFLVTILFFWIFSYRLNNAQRGSLRHALVFDEAKMVFSKERATGSSSISRLVSTGRELCECLVLSDQFASGLGQAILANVFTMICLNLSATRDIQDMGFAMGLNAEQRSLMNRLPLGTGIVKLADRYPRPFLVQFPDFPLQKNVTDAELASHIEPRLRDLPYKPRIAKDPPVSAWSAEDRASSIYTYREDSVPPDTAHPAAGSPSGTETNPPETSPAEAPAPSSPALLLDPRGREYTYLMDVKNRPYLSIVQRNRALRLTNYMANRIVRKLHALGLVEEREIHSGGKGRANKFLELTDKAIDLVGPQNLGSGKGGFEHVYHQQRLREYFAAQGYTAVIEQFENGKAVDVGLVRDDRRAAIEVAMSPQGEVDNFEKDLRAGWHEVWSFARTQNIQDHIKREWEEKRAAYPEDSVKFFLLTDPLNNSRGDF